MHSIRLLFRDFRLGVFSSWLAMRRPYSLRMRCDVQTSVVIASWNTRKYLEVALRAIHQYPMIGLKIVVVDNNSSDGSPEFVRENYPNVVLLELRRNVGHGLAVDFAIHKSRSEEVVVLDVDAFPISPEWQRVVLDPLRNGASLSGAGWCGYVHPSFMAIRRDFFLRQCHTFDASYTRSIRRRSVDWPEFWDAGQLISIRDSGLHFHVPPTSVRGPHALGVVFGNVVYHNFYSTQHPGSQVTQEMSDDAWSEAVQQYL